MNIFEYVYGFLCNFRVRDCPDEHTVTDVKVTNTNIYDLHISNFYSFLSGTGLCTA